MCLHILHDTQIYERNDYKPVINYSTLYISYWNSENNQSINQGTKFIDNTIHIGQL